MQKLNLPPFSAKTEEINGKLHIFDIIRMKNIVLTPEEWVRQHFIHLLISQNYPKGLIAVEKLVVVNNLRQRADIVIYNRKGKPALIVECKAPQISLDNSVIAQAARYNSQLNVPYIVITNGLATYCVYIDLATKKYEVLTSLPTFEALNDV